MQKNLIGCKKSKLSHHPPISYPSLFHSVCLICSTLCTIILHCSSLHCSLDMFFPLSVILYFSFVLFFLPLFYIALPSSYVLWTFFTSFCYPLLLLCTLFLSVCLFRLCFFVCFFSFLSDFSLPQILSLLTYIMHHLRSILWYWSNANRIPYLVPPPNLIDPSSPSFEQTFHGENFLHLMAKAKSTITRVS